MSDGLSQQASQPPLAGGGGGGSQVPAVTSTGAINTGLSITLILGPRSTGALNASMAQTAVLTVPLGTSGRSLAVSQLTGSDTASLGSTGRSLAVSQLTGSDTASLGSSGRSLSVDSTILGRGFVTTAATTGVQLWTLPANVEADDAATANWLKSDALGAGAAATTSGTLTATNPRLGTTPSGWTRTKVEALVHYSNSCSGMNATGDTATLNVQLQDKTGALLQNNIVNDVYTSNQTHVDATTTVDVTTSCAAVSDADLALTKLQCTATFARTLVATGTRAFNNDIDSLSLRVTYTRTGIS